MTQKPSVKEVTPAEVQAGWEAGADIRLVDVRERDEWLGYHIPGALLLPLSEFAARCQEELGKDKQIVCLCEHGIRSMRAAAYLASLGFEDVATMTGGMDRYEGVVESGDV